VNARKAASTGRIPIIVDCDTGIDDSLALLYAVASPECELVAVTCTAGNVDARQVAENTRAVLELAGRSDVEVAIGRETPLARALVTTPETHGPHGIGYAELPPATTALSPRYSPDLIVEEARRRPGELTLVTLAPLTNVALAVLREPELPRLLRRVVIMGGSYRSAGNTAPTTEWNVSVDPESAAIVFAAFGANGAGGASGASGASGLAAGLGSVARPIALGLDVTERARLLPEHLARLADRAGCAPDGSVRGSRPDGARPDGARQEGARPDGARRDGAAAPNPIVRYLADALRFYMEFHSRYDHFYGAFIHDPLALATALDPSLVRTEALTVDVELGGRLTTGETVTDWRRVWGRPPNLDVAVEADAAMFFERFIERVGALAAARVAGILPNASHDDIGQTPGCHGRGFVAKPSLRPVHLSVDRGREPAVAIDEGTQTARDLA
jgi:purine nucleosidase